MAATVSLAVTAGSLMTWSFELTPPVTSNLGCVWTDALPQPDDVRISMTERPTFVLILRAEPGIDPILSLRALLKAWDEWVQPLAINGGPSVHPTRLLRDACRELPWRWQDRADEQSSDAENTAA